MPGVATALRYGVDDLTVRFGHITALDSVSLDAQPGGVTAVVGGDGAGKSTLLRVLAHRVRAESGRVRTLDRELIGYQPATSGVWPTLTVQENVDFVGRSFAMPAARLRERSRQLLEQAGLSAARSRLGAALSGGMRQKLGFVLAILHEPQLVLLDEPSTGVDPVSRVELWRLISATATSGTAVVMATTYLDEAQRAASVVALDGGRMLAAGTPDEVVAAVPGTVARLDDPDAAESADFAARVWRRGTERHVWLPAVQEPASVGCTALTPPDFEDALVALSLARAGAQEPGAQEPGAQGQGAQGQGAQHAGAQHAGAQGQGAQHAGAEDPGEAEADGIDTPHVPLHGRHAADAAQASGPAASAVGVTKRYGHATALDDVGIEARPGEIVGLIGANGAGKTTLLRILLGLERADAGDVRLFGAPPTNAARRRLGYVPQGLGLYTTLSVNENVGFLSRVYDVPRPQLPPALREVQSSLVSDIGLGRQRQLAFLLALSHGPELLVLDEPTSGVDPLGRARLWDVIHGQAAAGRAVIVTTHYLQEAEQCTRLVLLAQGRLIGSGAVADLTAGASALLVRSADWQRAFEALDRSGLPIMLTGRDIRVAGRADAASPHALRARVQDALTGIPAQVTSVPATLEETMVLLDLESAAGASGARPDAASGAAA